MGTQVTVNGSGWLPGDRINLSWNFPPFKSKATVRADANGAFTSATIAVPQEAPIGPTQINAISAVSPSVLVWAPFTVTPVFLFNVDSTRGWQSTGVKVSAGQSLTFSAEGTWTVDFRNFSYVDPDGYSAAEDSQIFQGCKLDPQLPYGKLLAKIADAPFWVIGSGGTFTADRDGFLEVRIHDADPCLVDNAGSVKGTVTGEGLARREPTGQAPNLIVLVHGCCTDANGVKEWDVLSNEIAKKIKKKNDWEIVVWDWSYDTPISPNFLDDATKAYENADIFQAPDLADAIAIHPYKHVHFIAHSAGAKLIDEAAFQIALNNTDQAFLHLTFLDAHTQDDNDKNNYGGLPIDYPHYAEHYVDKGFPSTDACLLNAFNFNITGWEHNPLEFPGGHQWPRAWYKNSVTSTSPKFRYGFPLSLEGSGKRINKLQYPEGQQCDLTTTQSNKNQKCQRAECWK